MPPMTALLDNPETVHVLAHPVRLGILAALRTPSSGAEIARAIGQTRQNVNYHLKELERAGLVTSAGERRKGVFVEQLFEPVARSFVVSPRLGWVHERQRAALRDQVALERLVSAGEQLQRDASSLLERAAFAGEEVPSASVAADVKFADEAARAAFMEEYLAALKPLLTKYGSRDGTPFRVLMATYPTPEEQT